MRKIIIVILVPLITIIIFFFILKKGSKFSQKQVEINNHSNVLLITLDTTRADKIGIYGCKDVKTPNIDSLAMEGVRFENAYSSVPITFPSHCSIFTGTYPLYHKARNNGNYFLPQKIETLTEILKRNGYTTSAFISSFTVDSRFGLDQGFDVYHDDFLIKNKGYNSERPAELVYKDFSQWFGKNFQKKFFTWVHFFDPHSPYAPPEPYKTEYSSNPYLGEIAYADFYVGKIVELLKANHVFENTLIIIAGDHGEAFGEHKEFGHQVFCYEENLKVPLIFYAKDGLHGNLRFIEKVNLIDIMPTLLDFIQLSIPAFVQGFSLMPLINDEKIKERDFYIESVYSREALGCAPIKGNIQKDFKFIDLPKPELYNLKTDPEEKNNLISKHPILLNKLKYQLNELIKIHSTLEFNSQRKLSQEEKNRLASLGYISATQRKNNTQMLPDPKDGIEGYNEFFKGVQLARKKNFNEAEKYFKKAISITPFFVVPYGSLARIYQDSGRSDDAIRLFKKGIENNPDGHFLKFEYAQLLLELNRIDDAEIMLKKIEKLNLIDLGIQIHTLLGDINFIKKKYEQSINDYKKVLNIEPENRYIKKSLGHIFHISNRFPEALNIYLELENEDPKDLDLSNSIAILYIQMNELDKAENYFERLINNYPNVADIYYNYAGLLAKRGKFKRAISTMEKFMFLYKKDDLKKGKAQQYIKEWKGKN